MHHVHDAADNFHSLATDFLALHIRVDRQILDKFSDMPIDVTTEFLKAGILFALDPFVVFRLRFLAALEDSDVSVATSAIAVIVFLPLIGVDAHIHIVG